MLKRLKDSFICRCFESELPFDHCAYALFFPGAFMMSIPTVITNMLLHRNLAGILLQWAYIILCIVMLFMPARTRQAFQKPNLLFVSFVYIPFLYFQTAGYDGMSLFFSLPVVFVLNFIFSGRKRVAVMALCLVECLFCILLSYWFPQLVTPYLSPLHKLLDVITAVCIVFIGLGFIITYFDKAFKKNSKALEELSLRDALTGVYTRRILGDFLQHELEVARESGQVVYVLMLDIDHFKHINDAYGHSLGDRILSECAKTIQGIIRSCDMLVRYGGDEFVIILPPPLPFSPYRTAEHIRQEIHKLVFEGNITITVSIGAEKSTPEDTVDTFLHRADQRMYEAKRNGRNQVILNDAAAQPDRGKKAYFAYPGS